MRIIKIFFLLFIFSFNSFSQENIERKPSLKNLKNNESIGYISHLIIESFSQTQILTVKKIDSIYFLEIDTKSTSKRKNNFKFKTIQLSKNQIDTLLKFENAVYLKKITHNQGLKFAGRLGIYYVSHNSNLYKFESRNLYGLLTALNIKSK